MLSFIKNLFILTFYISDIFLQYYILHLNIALLYCIK